MGRHIKAVVAMVATIALASVGIAYAVTGSVGNPAIDGDIADQRADFTIVDTNNPADVDGYFTAIDYYADDTRYSAGNYEPIRFVLVDEDLKVQWVSDEVTAPAPGPQAATFPPTYIEAGWNLAVYSSGQGVVSYARPGAEASYTPPNDGAPVIGDTLTEDGSDGRIYSMGATITACDDPAIGAPLSQDEPVTFNARRGVIPVKMSACEDLFTPTLSLVRVGSGDGGADETLTVDSRSKADSGSTMRWDVDGSQYVYNLDAGSLVGGSEYRLTVSGAGDPITVTFHTR